MLAGYQVSIVPLFLVSFPHCGPLVTPKTVKQPKMHVPLGTVFRLSRNAARL